MRTEYRPHNGLVDSNGTQVVSYEYDSWGKLVNMVDDSTHGIGTKNPFRYRGYCYDDETGYYYLKSRYYDPEVGRFVNADILMNGVNGKGKGRNLFEYCCNDPVGMEDSDGHRPKISTESWIRYRLYRMKFAIKSRINKLKRDIENYDPDNTDEQKVLDSNYFSSYKGKLVLRTDLSRSGSFGILFIKRDFGEAGIKYQKDEVRHEYGHTIQLEQLGVIKYTLGIGIPSMLEVEKKLLGVDYYAQRYESTADMYGGVRSRCYPESVYDEGFNYLEYLMDFVSMVS